MQFFFLKKKWETALSAMFFHSKLTYLPSLTQPTVISAKMTWTTVISAKHTHPTVLTAIWPNPKCPWISTDVLLLASQVSSATRVLRFRILLTENAPGTLSACPRFARRMAVRSAQLRCLADSNKIRRLGYSGRVWKWYGMRLIILDIFRRVAFRRFVMNFHGFRRVAFRRNDYQSRKRASFPT